MSPRRTEPRLVRRVAVVAAALVAIAGVGAVAARARPAPPPVSAATEARVRDADIAFYLARAARDPSGAADLAQLGVLYLERARATGDNADLERAERAARRSLGNRTAWNARARQVLAASLLSQHRYAEALAEARRLVRDDPDRPSLRAMQAELEMEVGDYAEARQLFRGLASRAADPSVGPRLARWAELEGRDDAAHALLVRARDAARADPATPAEQRAWFELRVGDLALRHGHLGEAADALDRGLALAPDDYRLLAARARLAAVRHDWPGVVADGERSIAVALDPATLGLLGDAYAALGDSARADETYRVMEVAVSRQPGAFHRAWSLFLLDRGRDVATVLAKARAESATRHDIYGDDLLAWALYRAGDLPAARAASARALRLGTHDAMLHFHAGMIARALGDDRAAAMHLATALAENPSWHHTQPAAARAVLDSIRAETREGGR